MSSGPCLCGDPYCPSCGDPSHAEIEAAEESAMERMSEAKLTAFEYETIITVGLAAVTSQRAAVKAALDEKRAEDATAKDEEAAEKFRIEGGMF